MAATNAAYAFCALPVFTQDLARHRLQALRQRTECVGIGALPDGGDGTAAYAFCALAGSTLPGTAFRPSARGA